MLGESPVWDARLGRIYWVDSVLKMIRYHDLTTGKFGALEMPSMIGSVAMAQDGRLVAGLADGIYLVDLETGSSAPLFQPEEPDDRVRFNDGKVDPQGRFLCGTMGLRAEPLGELYRVDADGNAEVLANGIRISNSLCFSPDGKTIYFADSLDRKVRAYTYDDDSAALTEPRIHVDTAPFSSAPDGATVDSDGCIWVALVQAGKIGRFTPEGKLDLLIESPSDMPTCVAFGGPLLDTLFITTIKDSQSGRALSRHPLAGHLFAIEGLGFTGLEEPRFQ
ncbi:putative transcriptional regulator; putative regucalcin family protein [Pseudooceanicola batsensis HTCC2597]|uniref:Putative transcriptional regulator putative regucalcin family protein n=2 Tax=Pseudooceanicola batsensis TaxID=314255 RepID=A3U145_PSEBH|nr:putative transcriptional regulator; putative regucalcin family protein [Pseudooceanicola batsensis HTCC2597]